MNCILGFQPRFVPLVEAGPKLHTIRRRRADGKNPEPGDTLYLYAHHRSKLSRRIGTEVCEKVADVLVLPPLGPIPQIYLGGELLIPEEADAFSRADGFADTGELLAFLDERYGLPFSGLLICWKFTPTYYRVQ